MLANALPIALVICSADRDQLVFEALCLGSESSLYFFLWLSRVLYSKPH